MGASTGVAERVTSRPVTITCGAGSPASRRASRALRLAVRAGRVVEPSFQGALAASRPTSPVTARRKASTQQGSTLRVPVRQAVRKTAVPVSTGHEASRPAASLQGIAQDGTSSARRCVGSAVVANAEDASGVLEAGVTTLPNLDVPAILACA